MRDFDNASPEFLAKYKTLTSGLIYSRITPAPRLVVDVADVLPQPYQTEQAAEPQEPELQTRMELLEIEQSKTLTEGME